MSQTRADPAQRRKHQILVAAVIIGFLALILAVGVAANSSSTSGGASQRSNAVAEFAGPVFPAHLRASSFSLTDQNGNRATLSQYRGQVVVLSFMYSHCRDACPLMATEIRGALDELPGGGLTVPVLAVSVDPAHDTRASARAFLARERMDGRMRFLLGRPRQLQRIWKRYAIQPEFAQSGRQYSYGHSAFVMLIDRRGYLRVGFPAGQLVPEDLAHDLKLLLTQRS